MDAISFMSANDVARETGGGMHAHALHAAAHVVEALEAARSARSGAPAAVTSTFPAAEPMEWAR